MSREEAEKAHLSNLLGPEEPEQEPEAQTPEPEAQTEAPEVQSTPEPQEKTVPLSALEAERKKWQKKLDEQNRTVQEQIAALREDQQKANEPKETVPDPQEDPVGYFMWEGKQRDKEIQEVRKTQKRHEDYMQALSQMEALDQAFSKSATKYRTEVADFDDAHKYFLDNQRQRLQLLGFEPKDIDIMLQQTMMGTVMQAIQTDQDVADTVYKLARMSGYQGPQTPEPETPQMTQPVEPAMDQEAFKRIQQGQRATGLQTTGSTPRSTGMTPQEVANLSQDQFDRMMDMETFRRLMSEGSIPRT